MSQSEAPNPAGSNSQLSNKILAIAAEVEAALRDGRAPSISPDAVQALLACGVKCYAAAIEAGCDFSALAPGSGVTPTDVMMTASGLLKSANLAVFELGMWQGWTGR